VATRLTPAVAAADHRAAGIRAEVEATPAVVEEVVPAAVVAEAVAVAVVPTVVVGAVVEAAAITESTF